jgi:hypothetical protein
MPLAEANLTDPFYLGKLLDPGQGKAAAQPLHYDPADLTTHAVVTGMTGSGKTGLCIALMEEAALQGIPAVLIDPKGDLTNLLLHFPDLAPQDFQPWLDPELARRAGQSVDQAAAQAAAAWRRGLAEWGIGRERLLALKNAAQYAVYTPGSDAGIPVSVLASLAAPALDWAGSREVLTERITSTVTALLGLVGFDEVDPLQSREHILLSNIFQSAWSQGRSLGLAELILQIQTPPFGQLGAFPVESFFPAKARRDLALQINNILAAPSFELWRVGQPLDPAAFLQATDGRPRQSVFYLAHLSEAERMFFVTLLLSAVETWMRSQAGSSSLRALLYMDEIYGFLPPSRNPPSKQPLLRMLKQARAFGLGLVLATQNPVDLDYKGLSNAGTWFIGKLQTEQDKQRLLDGLESAAPGTLNRAALDKLISALGKRIFIMNNVHARQPVVFEARWAMNFLAGPLTRAQIPALNRLVGASLPPAAGPGPAAPPEAAAGPASIPDQQPPINNLQSTIRDPQSSLTRPAVPTGYPEYFLPLNLSFTRALAGSGQGLPAEASMVGIVYRPVLLASAQVRFVDRKYGLDLQQIRSALVVQPDRRGVVRWEDFSAALPDEKMMDPAPDPQAGFAGLEPPLSDPRQMTALRKDFADWIFRTGRVIVRANRALGVFATPDISQAELMKACAEAARERRDTAVAKATAAIDRQIKTLADRIAREERELKMDEAELGQRKSEEVATHAENVLGVFGRGRSGRRLSTSLSKHRMTSQAREDVQESVDALAQYRQQLAELEASRQQILVNAGDQWGEAVNDIDEIPVAPRKADVYVSMFGVAWLPRYRVRAGDEELEIPAYAAPE